MNSSAAAPARAALPEPSGLLAPELDSALQLLVERAQYITGATGAAFALPYGEEMVCRASAGSSAPAVGARLQVVSGLTGESIARRQLLRCDNAETDPRVNLEACRALGIASIVVLPIFRPSGELRGLIELFSDHPYAFEERDLVALERMADLTLTALNMAEQRQDAPAFASRPREADKSLETSSLGNGDQPRLDGAEYLPPTRSTTAEAESLEAASQAASPAALSATDAVPEAMRRVHKCESCGFPVSEGRTVCLDCEKKKQLRSGATAHQSQPQPAETLAPSSNEEFIPAFLANAPPVSESWLANHVNILAIIVLILGIVVAVVVFR